jgi:hypothetical protein
MSGLDALQSVQFITTQDQAIDVVAVRKRPPYNYGDIAQLLASH